MLTLDTYRAIRDGADQDDKMKTLIALAFAEAVEKWPLFPDRLCLLGHGTVKDSVESFRSVNKKHPETTDARYVLLEEVMEMIDDANEGDAEAARRECAQCIAVLMRIWIHMDAYCGKGGKE
jgi:hypothetical protein